MLFKVQYRGCKKYVKLNGASFSELLTEVKKKFCFSDETNVFLLDDSGIEVEEDVFSELLEEKTDSDPLAHHPVQRRCPYHQRVLLQKEHVRTQTTQRPLRRAPEILFKPELIGRDHYGMHESIFKSILSSDIDLRRMFLGNIVLSGGNTLLPGLPERLQEEIRGMVPSGMGECVHVTSPKDRDFLVWSGGSVLANLPSFASAWISQEEYEEFGPQIVFRKCF